MDTLQQEKSCLRRAVLGVRDALSAGERKSAAAALLDHIADLPPVQGRLVSGYWPIKSEIDPRPLMSALKEKGAELALPVVLDATRLEFRLFDKDESLVDAGFGTKGPPVSAPVVDPDILLMPVAVFDRRGGRIGYGAGYYDRALHQLSAKGREPVTIGLAHSCQQVAKVPQDVHDQPLHMVLTPDGLIRCKEPRVC